MLESIVNWRSWFKNFSPTKESQYVQNGTCAGHLFYIAMPQLHCTFFSAIRNRRSFSFSLSYYGAGKFARGFSCFHWSQQRFTFSVYVLCCKPCHGWFTSRTGHRSSISFLPHEERTWATWLQNTLYSICSYTILHLLYCFSTKLGRVNCRSLPRY